MKKIALIGNPNSGKSSLFNQLSGLNQKISNYPGVTVERKSAIVSFYDQKIRLIDLPGLYSVFPNSFDERLVVNILSNPNHEDFPDLVIYVADSLQLEKHLLLATQINDLGIPMILAVNMKDLADDQNLRVDTLQLADSLKIHTLFISCRTGENIDTLKKQLASVLSKGSTAPSQIYYRFSKIEQAVVDTIQGYHKKLSPYACKLLAHHYEWIDHLNKSEKEQIHQVVEKGKFNNIALQIEDTLGRYAFISPLVNKIAIDRSKKEGWSEKVDAIVTHRVFGPFLFFAIMMLMFQAIFAWSALPMGFIEESFSQLAQWSSALLGDTWYSSLVSDGIIAGLGGVMTFIPQIAILFFIILLLEEIGYMSRAVYLFDDLLQGVGLNGRSIVALVSSSACAIPAIMSARTIPNWKERMITIMVSPLISCSARLPVYTVLVGFVVPSYTVWGIFNSQALVFMGLYLLGIVAALVSAYVFKKIIKSRGSSFLMMELPSYKKPIWKNIWLGLKNKVGSFIIEAGKIILLISILLWFLASYGPSKAMEIAEKEATQQAVVEQLDTRQADDLLASKKLEASYAGHLGKALEPVIKPLGYDWKIGIALITSFAAREVFVGTMSTIYSIGSTGDETTIREKMALEVNPNTGKKVYGMATAWSLLLFYVFAMQCMSTLAVTKKETQSWKWPMIQFLYMTALAIISSFLAFQILS